MKMSGSGDVSCDFAHPEVIGEKLFCVFDDLASGNNGTGYVLESVETAVREELIDGLTELTEVAGSALAANTAASDSSGVYRFGSAVQSFPDSTLTVHKSGFESC